jgi:hypothetical protein
MANNKRPVMDSGEPYREVPYRAGQKNQGSLSTRKGDLLGAGPGTGFLPGGQGQGKRSFVQSGYVHEVPHKAGPVPGFDDLEYAPNPRPRPRDIPVSSTPIHYGTAVRHLDGSTRIVRERPELVELMNHPSTSPADRADLKEEIARRDAVNLHKWW